MEFRFRRHFRLRPKMKHAFRSACSIHHKKVVVLVFVLRCKVVVLVLNIRLSLGLGLGFEKKSWLHHYGICTRRISQKRCVLRSKLLKNTNRKPYPVYRTVPFSLTWVTTDPDFKATTFLDIEYLRNDTRYSHSYYRTSRRRRRRRRRRADVRAQAVVPLCPTLKYSTIHLQYKIKFLIQRFTSTSNSVQLCCEIINNILVVPMLI